MAKGGSKKGERRGGRKKGVPNKATSELGGKLRELARAMSPEALERAAKVMRKSKNETAVLKAIDIILERAWGRPAQSVIMTGDEEGGPVVHRLIPGSAKAREAAEMYALMREGKR